MARFYPAIQHTTNKRLPLGKGKVHSSILCGSTSLKALVIKAFFQRNTHEILPYDKRVGRKFGRKGNTCHILTTGAVSAYPVKMGVLSRVVIASLLAVAVAGCVHGDRNSAAREEYKARPGCAGIVDAAAWTDCMERFKDIRPQHPPTALQFSDWRT